MGFLAGYAVNRPVPPALLAVAGAVTRRLRHRLADGVPTPVPLALSGPENGMLLSGGAVANNAEVGLTLVFDGRIDDRGALRSRLRHEGREARGEADAVLALAAWSAWGVAGLAMLGGRFAMAVHDARAGTLTLARDRFGQCPLFWSGAGARLCFASEIQALLAWPGLAREGDPDAIAHVLGLGHSPAGATPLRDVRRLEPGHLLTRHADGRLARARWAAPLAADTTIDKEPSGGLQRRLRAALDRGPGGGLATSLSDPRDEAWITVGDGGGGAAVHDAPAALLRLTLRSGEPLLLPAADLLAPRTRGLPLSAAGADILLLGHDRYDRFARDLARLRADRRPPPWWSPGFHAAAPFARDLYAHAAGCLTEAERLEFCGPALAHTLLSAIPDTLGDSLEEATAGDAAARAAAIDLASRLPSLDLALLDAASPADGTAPFCPFLDEDVAGWCAALPPQARRAAAVAWCPGRPDQDTECWLPREGSVPNGLRAWCGDVLLSAASLERGMFGRRAMEALVDRAGRGPVREGRALWAMLCLETWFAACVDRMPAMPSDRLPQAPLAEILPVLVPAE